MVGFGADLLAEAAENYMRHLMIYSFTSEDELRELFASADFAFERLTPVAVAGKVGQPQAGPGTSQSATYAEFVATRV